VKVSDLLSLEGKVALVTGSRRGIGRAIALAFAEAGADVAVCDNVVEGGELGVVAEEIQGLGRRSLAIQADVSRKADVDNLVQEVMGQFSAIDILVNNAGIGGVSETSLFEAPQDEWDTVIGINLKSHYLCSQAVGKGMVERGGGNIIGIASMWGFRATMGRPYTVSKAGVVMLTRVLARELSPYNIRVNAIAPGPIITEMTRGMWSDPEFLKQLKTQIPMDRMAEPSEIGSVALFLASEASSYITGITIIADGGMLA